MNEPEIGSWVVVYDDFFGMTCPQWTKVDDHWLDGIEVKLLEDDVTHNHMYFKAHEYAVLGAGLPTSWKDKEHALGIAIEAGPHGAPSENESGLARLAAAEPFAAARADMEQAVAEAQAKAARHPASQMFVDIVGEMVAMHDRKQADYGSATDPFANVRGSAAFGIEPWVGAIVRANDKMNRLQAAARGQNLVNESIEDSLIDLAVYAVIGIVLFRQSLEDIGHGD